MKKFFRNIILGEKFIQSRSEYKAALLRGQLAILTFFVAIIYMISDGLYGHTEDYPIYYAMLVAGSGIFFLNRFGYFTIASVVLLSFLNTIVFILDSSDVNAGGVHIFYVSLGLAGLALFGYRGRLFGYIFTAISFFLFLLAYYTDVYVLDPQPIAPDFIKTNYLINYSIAFFVAVLVINFLISNNYQAELRLKENQDQLFTSRRRYELAIKGSRAGIWEWNIVTGDVYNSPVWKALLGYNETELGLLTLDTFLSKVFPEDRQRVGQAVREHIELKTPYLIEFRMLKKDGSLIWVLDSGQAVWSENGMPQDMVGSIIDITERKETERKIIHQNELLAKANEELDRFVYSASHDLRAPLSSILGLVNLAGKTNSADELHTYLDMIKSRVDKLEVFIKEIIAYSRNARLELDNQPFNLKLVVMQVLENLSHMPGADKLDVKINCPDNLVINADVKRLQVVLNNLLANAIKYADFEKETPFINFSVDRLSDVWGIKISDNGVGIKQEYIDKIFNMFFRASDKSDGSGLGLYITKETLVKMGGTIKAESVHGEGSSFRITLPILSN